MSTASPGKDNSPRPSTEGTEKNRRMALVMGLSALSIATALGGTTDLTSASTLWGIATGIAFALVVVGTVHVLRRR